MNAPTKQPTITDIIRDAFKKTQDRDEATKYALDAIYKDRALYKLFADDLIASSVRDKVREECGRLRVEAWNATQRQRAEELSDIASRELKMAYSSCVRCLMEMPLSRGNLGDYNGPMLDAEAEMYERNAKSLNRSAFFFRMVRGALPDDEARVRAALDEQALASMREKVGQ
jgi:cell division protein FtsL